MNGWTVEGMKAEVGYRRELLMAATVAANGLRPPQSWVTLQRLEAELATTEEADADAADPELGPERRQARQWFGARWFGGRKRPAAYGDRTCTA
ncbi:hypothetical protein [Streptoalloteichus hindustanus]|uniref:Uncharacterized protein n=1 Tax=Streptoalloteichus hindustanus TaxID=2017 RepID=A0A1M5AES7_STRHI|nr:hypothetical protein [Streptoalloteichus hindustanus]SHF28739.1 hypothetical protein SAMN05444320_10386 [Streptoalloteichus hindustanus]